MKQGLPVIRQISWAGFLIQFAIIAILALFIYPFIVSRTIGPVESVLVAALIYWGFCILMRRIFASDQRRGMKAYRTSKFEEALVHFQRSFEFFSKHPRLDRYRFFLLGTASPNPYATIALCNMAYCETQLGHGQRAVELYEQALHLTPGCTLAQASIRALRSMQNA